MRFAWFGPLPPVRSGIAHYGSLLVPPLAASHEVTCVTDQEEVAAAPGSVMTPGDLTAQLDRFDAVFCQLGNNPYHEQVYRWALEHPAIVVIHDLVLHHLLVEMTLARGDAAGYVEAMERNHGAAGRAWALGRVAGFHAELGNFIFPAFREIASTARHLIVHNVWAARRIRQEGVTTPITVAPHPWIPPDPASDGALEQLRARFGIDESDRVLSMLGFVTESKRVPQVFRAFSEVAQRDPKVKLVVAGAPAPNVDLQALAREAGVEASRWIATGYLADEEFDVMVALSERVVNLRYPTAGETSGPLTRVIGAGRPVAVSDYAQFAGLPDGVVVHIPLGAREEEDLVRFMRGESGCNPRLQREWAEKELTVERAVAAYERAANGEGDRIEEDPLPPSALALFPEWSFETSREGGTLVIHLQSRAAGTVYSQMWGTPGYRLIADIRRNSGEQESVWLPLGSDVRQGEVATVRVAVGEEWERVELRDGLEGIPDIVREPWGRIENDAG